MNAICLIDTTVLLNLLNVPNRSQNSTKISKEFADFVELDCTFIIPLVAVIETGNHISQNGDGRVRRESANRFFKTIKQSLNGEIPFRISDFDLTDELKDWLGQFPDEVGKNKLPTKPNEGISLTDFSIVKEFEKLKNLKVNDKIIIKSRSAGLSPNHPYLILSSDYIEQNKKILFMLICNIKIFTF